MERLRNLARSDGADPRALVRETASALRGMGDDPAGLVVACRRIVERHPMSGPMWWLCAHVVTAAEPYGVARRLADDLEGDQTADLLAQNLPADSRVCMIGWPDLAGEAVLRRGDIAVLAVDTDEQTAAFVRRLGRAGVMTELIPPASLTAAVLVADIVLIEAMAACNGEVLAANGSRAAASVAYCSGVPVIAVIGRGRRLPDKAFASVVARVVDVDAPWFADAEVVPIGLFSHVVGPLGFQETADASLAAECPLAQELL